ncbi:MAG: winged helix-turn-helix transcriptional regulator [Deltaproteobacteria bacterium]|nr:winged helix-turn-helix transcriptional regulator [Deltaproteobacteria bacterium]
MPRFEEFQHGFRVTVFKTPQKTPQKESLSDRILQLVAIEPRITQKEVGERLGISFDTAREYFARLKKNGRLVRVGGRRNGYWKVIDEMRNKE